jgi:hypothetical protein
MQELCRGELLAGVCSQPGPASRTRAGKGNSKVSREDFEAPLRPPCFLVFYTYVLFVCSLFLYFFVLLLFRCVPFSRISPCPLHFVSRPYEPLVDTHVAWLAHRDTVCDAAPTVIPLWPPCSLSALCSVVCFPLLLSSLFFLRVGSPFAIRCLFPSLFCLPSRVLAPPPLASLLPGRRPSLCYPIRPVHVLSSCSP